MSEDPVTRREFDLYVRMNAETNQNISLAIDAIKGQGQETLDVLKEYTIHNNHKHDNTSEVIATLSKKVEALSEAVIANSKISEFWAFIARYFKYSVIGLLTVVGAYFAKEWLGFK